MFKQSWCWSILDTMWKMQDNAQKNIVEFIKWQEGVIVMLIVEVFVLYLYNVKEYVCHLSKDNDSWQDIVLCQWN